MSEKPNVDSTRQFVIGTAGHIDHGKTALVKALSGVDTDRLPEEKKRGITIDLGFAHLTENITFIDVPGHERFIKNMVAGVSSIDLVLFVIAADDGVMPQTREHFDIINLLHIRHGIFVITKTDLADDDWLMLVEDDIRQLLSGTAFADSLILQTSVAKSSGIDELRTQILETLANIPARADSEIFRQPVDRVFSVKGFGSVITGTVIGGQLKPGDELEIQPTGQKTRVRGMQSHDADVPEVRTGDRAAVNLANVEPHEIERGMVITQVDVFQPVTLMNVSLKMLADAPAPLKNNQRIRLHIHTAEVMARVLLPDAPKLNPGAQTFAQLRLESPLHAMAQDRFIIRQYSPQRTIGGGEVLQINPFRYRKKFAELFRETMIRLTGDDDKLRVLATFDRISAKPQSLWNIKISVNLPLADLQSHLKTLQKNQQIFAESIAGKPAYFSAEQIVAVTERVTALLAKYHQKHPGRTGMKDAEIISALSRYFPAEAIRKTLQIGVNQKTLANDSGSYRLFDFAPQLSSKDSAVYQSLERRYRDAGFAPPTVKDAIVEFGVSAKDFKEITRMLREEGKLVQVDATLLFHNNAFVKLLELLRDFFQSNNQISVTEFKDLIGSTRKHAIPLLEYLDNREITQRDGDARKAGPNLRIE